MKPGRWVREQPGGRYGRVRESTIEGLLVETRDALGGLSIETWDPSGVAPVEPEEALPVVTREDAVDRDMGDF